MRSDTGQSSESTPEGSPHPVVSAWLAGVQDRSELLRSPNPRRWVLGLPGAVMSSDSTTRGGQLVSCSANDPWPEGPFGRIDVIGAHLSANDPDTWWAGLRSRLADGGVVTVASLGPSTLPGLRAALGWPADMVGAWWPDMHDLGDALVRAGLADPVLESERLVLTYQDWRLASNDIQTFPWRPPAGSWSEMPSASWQDLLESQVGSDGRIRLSLELVYGHAWRAEPRLKKSLAQGAAMQFVPRNRFI